MLRSSLKEADTMDPLTSKYNLYFKGLPFPVVAVLGYVSEWKHGDAVDGTSHSEDLEDLWGAWEKRRTYLLREGFGDACWPKQPGSRDASFCTASGVMVDLDNLVAVVKV